MGKMLSTLADKRPGNSQDGILDSHAMLAKPISPVFQSDNVAIPPVKAGKEYNACGPQVNDFSQGL